MNLSVRKKIHVDVLKGNLKGKKIPVPPSLRGYRNVTSSLIKEALFQHIENYFSINLGGAQKIRIPFFDLCAGSAQIAIEALSRGIYPVHIVEKDRIRFKFLLENLKKIITYNDVIFHQKDFIRLADDIAEQDKATAFIDLPYSFWKEEQSLHLEVFFKNFSSKLIFGGLNESKKYLFIIQSPVNYSIPKEIKKIWEHYKINFLVKNYHYRKHYLNLVQMNIKK